MRRVVVAPDIAPDGLCSLIEAIENGNADGPPAHADCPAGTGADTIVLPASSTRTLTQDHNSTYTGLPAISSAITIKGNGSTIMRVADGTQGGIFRIFAVNGTGNLTLKNTTVSGGNTGMGFGGGVSNSGTLTLMNSTVSGNGAEFGGGVVNSGALTLINSTVSGNFVGFGSGGGLLNSGTAISPAALSRGTRRERGIYPILSNNVVAACSTTGP